MRRRTFTEEDWKNNLDELLKTEVLTEEQKQRVMNNTKFISYAGYFRLLEDEIKIEELLKNQYLTDDKKQRICKDRYFDNFSSSWSITDMLEREIAFLELYNSDFLSAEEKQQFQNMRRDKRPEVIVKKMNAAIEKAKKAKERADAKAFQAERKERLKVKYRYSEQNLLDIEAYYKNGDEGNDKRISGLIRQLKKEKANEEPFIVGFEQNGVNLTEALRIMEERRRLETLADVMTESEPETAVA